jgi:hypothetical protein
VTVYGDGTDNPDNNGATGGSANRLDQPRSVNGNEISYWPRRGIPPSAVENAIRAGAKSPGNAPGTFVHVGDGVTVVTTSSGRVVTVIPN